MARKISIFILLLLTSGFEVEVLAQSPPTGESCESFLDASRSHFLKRTEFLRRAAAERINQEAQAFEMEFWLHAVLVLKSEQAKFSDLYYLPKGEDSLSEAEKATLFQAYSKKFKKPEGEVEWSRFYFNHLQSLIQYSAAKLKLAWVRRVSAVELKNAEDVFDAVIYPTEIEDCSVSSERVIELVQSVTPEAMASKEVERRLNLTSLGPKPCCKTDGGCAYCSHNRRHFQEVRD